MPERQDNFTQQTIEFWQKRLKNASSNRIILPHEAANMTVNVAGFLSVLMQWQKAKITNQEKSVSEPSSTESAR